MKIDRGRWIRLRALLAWAMTVGVLGLTAGDAGAQPLTCRAGVRGAQDAAAMAEACGTEVEILDRRTAADSYFAEPDGTTTLRRWSGSDWTTVRSCAPNTSYWTTLRDAMRVGVDPGRPCIARVFVNIPLDGLAGIRVNHATFGSTMDHSAPCSSPTPEVRLSLTAQSWIVPGATVTWNNTSDHGTYRSWVVGSARPASANETGICGRDIGDQQVVWPVGPRDVQWFTDRAAPRMTFHIYSASETSWTTWKKFYAGSSYLEINFESAA